MGFLNKLFKKNTKICNETKAVVSQEIQEEVIDKEIIKEEEIPLIEIDIKEQVPLVEIDTKEEVPLVEIDTKEEVPLVEIDIKEEVPLVEIEEKQMEPEKKKNFFVKLKEGLDKTRKNIINSVDNVLSSFTKIDEDLFEELEEALIMSDIGVETTSSIIQGLRERVKRQRATKPSEIKQLLIDEITEILEEDETPFKLESPCIILVIGVNGVGKTTTIGKLANIYKQDGKTILLAAADTFRAAAIEQLEVWGKRSNIDIIKHQENSDPAAVVFDAVQAAKARKTDILICDTAGRLHNKKNLMEELRKIFKIINREYPNAQKEILLVLDGTTGQNALQQAKIFKEIANITGIVLTKLDGTAKGGIVIAIKSELKIPVRYVGVGESINDLQEFNAHDFASALFNE